jgi:hypothetical protein
MAEFHFWGAEEDKIAIIKAVLAFGDYQLLPDLHYLDPNPRAYKDAEPALFEALTRKKTLYVLGPYSKKPVFMEELDRGRDDGCYYVSEARGGPILSLSVPGCRVVDGIVELAPGNFSRRSEYWDDAVTTPTKASDELKQHYKLILGEIKRYLVRKKIMQPMWIGPEAWELLGQGKAIILRKGKWWDSKGNFVKSNIVT